MSVLFEVKEHVARVTLNRPERMNAVDAATTEELENIWQKIESDPWIRCVVLTGTGERAFCAGADLKEDSGLSGVNYWAHSNPNGFGGLSLRKSLSTPVIARVNGLALGGGMEMVLACDIVIASDTSKFGLPEAKVGRVPLDGGMILLPRLIPRNIAADLMMTGRMAGADEMASHGLVNSVVPADELDTEVDTWLANILKSAPLSLRAIKATMRDTATLQPLAGHALRTPELMAALGSEDSEEGVKAFGEKREPLWRGE
ncbi:MAG: enoyl-CoA hydratase-related protein [Stappiaceae bacterium]